MSENADLTKEEIRDILVQTSVLAQLGDFLELDAGLAMLDPHKMGLDAILAISRSLHSVRNNLENYLKFVRAARETELVKSALRQTGGAA